MAAKKDGLDGIQITRLNRRALLEAVLAISGALALPSGVAPAAGAVLFDSARFRELIVAMTGLSPRDPTLAQAFLDAFSDDLAQLKTLRDIVLNNPQNLWAEKISEAKLGGLAETLITACYTGTVGTGDNEKVITYLNAFVWYACGYTKPPSQCDWDFGAWADPPPEGRFEQ
jgi:hypothetical protein